MPGAPVLSISNAGNTVAVSWTTNFPGYTLQTNGLLAFPGAWADFPVAYNIVGLNYQVSDPIAAAPQFYRLKGPATTFYVDPAGNNANTGLSLAQAWQTTSYALTNAAFTNSFHTNATTLLFTGGSVFADTNAVGYFYAAKYPILLCGSGSSPAICSNYMEAVPTATNNGITGWSLETYDPTQLTVSNMLFTGKQSWLVTQSASNEYFIGLALVATNAGVSHDVLVTNCAAQYCGMGIGVVTGGTAPIFSNVTVGGCWFNSNIDFSMWVESFPEAPPFSDSKPTWTNIFAVNLVNNISSNITGCTTDDGTGGGYYYNNVSGGLIAGSVVHDCGTNCLNDARGGPSACILGACTAITVCSNEIYNILSRPGQNDGTGIDLDIASQGCTIEYNYVHGCDGPGLYAYESYGGDIWRFNVCISNCLAGNSSGTGELCINGGGGNYQAYNNNLMDLSGQSAIQIENTLSGSNIFVGNILYTTNNYAVNTVDITHVTFATNDYFRGDGSQAAFYWNGTTYSSFAAWTAATGQDPNGFHADPKWVSGYAVITNYPAQMSGITGWTLQAGSSPLLNKATGPYGFANGGIDFLGVDSLGATFNIGAVNASQ